MCVNIPIPNLKVYFDSQLKLFPGAISRFNEKYEMLHIWNYFEIQSRQLFSNFPYVEADIFKWSKVPHSFRSGQHNNTLTHTYCVYRHIYLGCRKIHRIFPILPGFIWCYNGLFEFKNKNSDRLSWTLWLPKILTFSIQNTWTWLSDLVNFLSFICKNFS